MHGPVPSMPQSTCREQEINRDISTPFGEPAEDVVCRKVLTPRPGLPPRWACDHGLGGYIPAGASCPDRRGFCARTPMARCGALRCEGRRCWTPYRSVTFNFARVAAGIPGPPTRSKNKAAHSRRGAAS